MHGCTIARYAEGMRTLTAIFVLSASIAQAQVPEGATAPPESSTANASAPQADASSADWPEAVRDAEALYLEAALDEAKQAFEQALSQGPYSPSVLAAIYWHLGAIAGLNHAYAEADDAFACALALDPTLRVPDEIGREGEERYRALQRVARRIDVSLRPVAPSAKQSTRVNVELRHAPSDFARTFRASAAPDGSVPWQTETSVEEGAIEIPAAAWRGGQRLEVEVDVLDAHGNVLTSGTTTLHAQAAEEAMPLTEERSVARSPWLWTGVAAVVIAGVATAILLSTRETRYEGGTVAIIRESP